MIHQGGRKYWLLSGLLLIVLSALTPTLSGAGVVSGQIFGDYYFNVKNNQDSLEKQNGFWLRRVNLTYDADISGKIKARGRIEMVSDGKFSTSQQTLSAFVKDAYISYQIAPRHLLSLGIQENIAFSTVEKYWGFRPLERPALDLYKQRESRDFGLVMKGSLDSGKRWGYAVVFANGSGTKQETNKGKVVGGRLTFSPSAPWAFEVYGDLTRLDAGKKSVFLQGFIGYSQKWGRAGVNFLHSTLTQPGKPDVDWNMLSMFALPKLAPKLEGVARIDIAFDPLTATQDSFTPIAKGTKPTTLIGGVSWSLHPKVQLIPNLKVVTYREVNGVKPARSDVYANLTFAYQF